MNIYKVNYNIYVSRHIQGRQNALDSLEDRKDQLTTHIKGYNGPTTEWRETGSTR